VIELAIVADDLTGAADSAAPFAQAGLATAIALGTEIPDGMAVVSRSTESRDIPAADATSAVHAAVAGLDARRLYKKLDSAMRGHPREELLAAMAARGSRFAVVAPAIPSQGRTTISSQVLVDGVPLHQSSFAGHGAESDLRAVFAGPDVTIELLDLSSVRDASLAERFASRSDTRLLICDAATDEDVARIAAAGLSAGVDLFAGAAGLSRALARSMGRSTFDSTARSPAGNGPILVIAASQHGATADQIDAAAATGIAVLRPDPAELDADVADLCGIAMQAATELEAGRHVIVTTAGLPRCRLGAVVVAERIAQIAATPRVRIAAGGMMVTGGDAAAAVCAALGATAIRLQGEVRPAIPWGSLYGGLLPGLPIVTKAGSFGDRTAILASIAFLTGSN
jgi:uncharacterized protein YgbK (DUF1537 family)